MIEKIVIDRRSRIPLYLQIKNQIQDMISQNVIPKGIRMPPTRKLSRLLGVNRSTIVSAYNELSAEGLIESRVGSGTVVCERKSVEETISPVDPLMWSEKFSVSSKSIHHSIIRESVNWLSQEGVISLASGYSPPEYYPMEDFKKIMKRLLAENSRMLVHQSTCQGHSPLREIISQKMMLEGMSADPDELIIVSGSMQGLYFLARVLLDPGDIVVVEKPSFIGALQIFREAGARIIGIPVDEEGMRVDILENIVSQQRPKLIYTLPTYQNPTGTVLSLERRQRLLITAYKYHVGIIEDNPSSRFYYGSTPPPSLKSLDRSNHVIHLSTFSKLLFPGLRIGWLAASQHVIERITRTRQFIDIQSNTLGEYVFYEFLREDLIERHLIKLRNLYSRKRDIMISALGKYCSSLMTWNKPGGGFHIWCRLNKGLSSRELLRESFYEKVTFLAGGVFFPEEVEGDQWLRLSFTYQPEDLIWEGIKRLSNALKRLEKKSQARIMPGRSLAIPIV